MRTICLAACVLILVGCIAHSGEQKIDIRSLREKPVGGETRADDLRAKLDALGTAGGYGDDARQLMKPESKASVTVGGTLNTRYFSRRAEIDSYEK